VREELVLLRAEELDVGVLVLSSLMAVVEEKE